MRYSITLLLLLAISISFAGTKGMMFGRVTDVSGTAIENVSVAVCNSNQKIVSTLTKANGKFWIANLSPDKYHCTFSREGYIEYQVDKVIDRIDYFVNVDANLQIKPVVIAKNPFPVYFETDKHGKIAGRVRNNQGHGIGYVYVSILNRRGKVIKCAVTNRKGRYKIDDVHPGMYDIQFFSHGYETLYVRDVHIRPGEKTIVQALLEVNRKRFPEGYPPKQHKFYPPKLHNNTPLKDISQTWPLGIDTAIPLDMETGSVRHINPDDYAH